VKEFTRNSRRVGGRLWRSSCKTLGN